MCRQKIVYGRMTWKSRYFGRKDMMYIWLAEKTQIDSTSVDYPPASDSAVSICCIGLFNREKRLPKGWKARRRGKSQTGNGVEWAAIDRSLTSDFPCDLISTQGISLYSGDGKVTSLPWR